MSRKPDGSAYVCSKPEFSLSFFAQFLFQQFRLLSG
jgi:hypothetical protein